MAMPRPSPEAQSIAEKVVPGLMAKKKRASRSSKKSRGSLSPVEVMQTNNIENRKGIR